MREISDAERRARLVARHHLGRTAAGVVDAARAVVALHSTDPVTPYLAAWARVPAFATADLDRALYEERTLRRMHAMRRTLFVVPAGDAAAFHAGAALDIARRERRRVEQWLGQVMPPARVPQWLAEVEARTLETLSDGREWRTQDLTTTVEGLGTELMIGSGRWAARSPLSSRLLFMLAMEGQIVRARPAGSWRSGQYRWSAASTWFGPLPRALDAEAARAELARRYLAANGPATLVDLRWWTGWTAVQARAALQSLGAEEVGLASGEVGHVLPGDVEGPPEPAPHVAFLPALDPTPMGWKQRDWFLPPAHVAALFDTNGNAGPTVWSDGRVVGGWGQRRDGTVSYRLLSDAGATAESRMTAEAAALTEWLDGVVVTARFRTPLEREIASA